MDFRLRMADDLHAQIKAAKERGEAPSINAWIVDAVEQKLAGTLRSTDPSKRLDRMEQDVREIKKRLGKLER